MPNLRVESFISRRATPGAWALMKKLELKSVGDLAKLDVQALESLRACASAAGGLVLRFPAMAEVDISTFEAKP